jgi:hypothetical protein
MNRFLSRLRLQRTFRDEALVAAWRDLAKHKFSYFYPQMISAYVRAYCRTRAAQLLDSVQE